MSEYSRKPNSLRSNAKVELNLSIMQQKEI